jgi:hypothetical protein
MTNHLYAQFADDGTTIANVCVVLDVGVVTQFPSGARTFYGIAEAEALGWAWLGPQDSPNVDPTTGLIPWTGWTASPAAQVATPLLPGQNALPDAASIGAIDYTPVQTAPTPATWSFSPPPDAIDQPISPDQPDPSIPLTPIAKEV